MYTCSVNITRKPLHCLLKHLLSTNSMCFLLLAINPALTDFLATLGTTLTCHHVIMELILKLLNIAYLHTEHRQRNISIHLDAHAHVSGPLINPGPIFSLSF